MKQMKSDLNPNEQVKTFFALESAEIRKTRDQRFFLVLTLSDKSGQLKGYIWNEPEEKAEDLRGVSYVYVEGKTKMYNGALILTIEEIRVTREEDIVMADFLEVVPGGVDLWMNSLREKIETIEDMNCRLLLDLLFSDQKFLEDFKIAPAAMTVHHNYVGGLMEHSVNTMAHAAYMSDKYPALLDRDLLLTGSLLHDIGKTRELTSGIIRSYTTEGRLLGHIPLGIMILDEKLHLMKRFPEDLGLLLRHMILSHHGSLEFGSPVRPATPEALALHHIENTDAKLNHLFCHLKNSDPERVWSSYDKYLASEIYQRKPKKEIADRLREVGAYE
jgi:3'-5' exoribonuclease